MRLRWLSLLTLMLVGCPYPNHRHDLRVRELPGPAPEDVSMAFFQTTGVALEPGNQVELVENGHVFDAIEEEVRAARTSFHIISYIWRPGEPSDRLVRALAERRPGVVCRVLVDPLGSVHFEQVQPQLVAAGCEVRVFRPLPADENLARQHRKLVIVDGKVGFTGGFGFHDVWLSSRSSRRRLAPGWTCGC